MLGNCISPNFTHTTPYAQVTAVDPDSGAGGIVSYSITDATPRDAMMNFNISSRTGAIMLMRTLDRETTSLITLRVAAQDQGVPGECVQIWLLYGGFPWKSCSKFRVRIVLSLALSQNSLYPTCNWFYI